MQDRELKVEPSLPRSVRQLLVEAAYAAANRGMRQDVEAMLRVLEWLVPDRVQRHVSRGMLQFLQGKTRPALDSLAQAGAKSEEAAALRCLILCNADTASVPAFEVEAGVELSPEAIVDLLGGESVAGGVATRHLAA